MIFFTKFWAFFNIFEIFWSNFEVDFGNPCDYHKSVQKNWNFYDPPAPPPQFLAELI